MKEEIIEKLKRAQSNDDIEIAHIEADNILCSFLKDLGYEDVVREYHKIPKWYA